MGRENPPGVRGSDIDAEKVAAAFADDRLVYDPVHPAECLVGGLNWPLCALGVENHVECWEATTGRPFEWRSERTGVRYVLASDDAASQP